MSGLKNVCIIGGDMRQVYMSEYLAGNNLNVYTYNLASNIENVNIHPVSSLDEAIDNSRIIILPIPVTNNHQNIFSKNQSDDMLLKNFYKKINKKHFIFGGCFPHNLILECKERDIFYHDFMSDEATSLLNAIATAEGSIMKAISKSVYNIHGNNSLIIGYGKCGCVLADKLKGLGSKCFVAARSYNALCKANSNAIESFYINDLSDKILEFKFIFNTVPSCILTPEILDLVSKETVIIDIASYPGGVDFDYAASIGLNAELFGGIPGKVSPKSSAQILANKILSFYSQPQSC